MNEAVFLEPRPTLRGEIVHLRPMTMHDTAAVAGLADDPAIAANTLNVPYPYTVGDAERFIAGHAERWASGTGLELAVVRAEDGVLVGCCGLSIRKVSRSAELGYWVGQRHWGRGYATAAAGLMIRFAIRSIGLNRVFAHHLAGNVGSGRVMIKNGMRYEGLLRQGAYRSGTFTDVLLYAILAEDLVLGAAADG